MYIKLTRLDGTPIWLNAAFIVTIEPRKQGGAVVVPIGDGLDYDVRESTEQVLAMLAEQEVSGSKFNVQGSETSNLEPETINLKPEPADDPKPTKRRRTKKAAADEGEGEPKSTTRKPRRKTAKTDTSAEPTVEVKSEPEPSAPVFADPVNTASQLSDDQIERLKRMAPRSRRKLLNTLATQFRVENGEAVLAELFARGLLTLEQEHVIWKNT